MDLWFRLNIYNSAFFSDPFYCFGQALPCDRLKQIIQGIHIKGLDCILVIPCNKYDFNGIIQLT
ncbi:hypothetical protein D3C81_1764780 [compost metagenome]